MCNVEGKARSGLAKRSGFRRLQMDCFESGEKRCGDAWIEGRAGKFLTQCVEQRKGLRLSISLRPVGTPMRRGGRRRGPRTLRGCSARRSAGVKVPMAPVVMEEACRVA